MSFGRGRSSLSNEQHGRKTRVSSLLPPKRRYQSYSMSQLSHSSQDTIQEKIHHQQQSRPSDALLHLSQQSYGSRSRGIRNDGPQSPSGSDRPEDRLRQQHPLSSQDHGAARTSQTTKGSNDFQPVYNDRIPLGQPSDFSSEFSSSFQRGLSQNQEPEGLPSSQAFPNSQNSIESRKSSLLHPDRSKLFNPKKTHFADVHSRSEMQKPPSQGRKREFLSQNSCSSRATGPLQAMNLSQSMNYGHRSSQSTFNSTLTSSQSQSLPNINRQPRRSPAQALLTRTFKAPSPASHIAFASNAALRKSQVERQQYPEICPDETLNGAKASDRLRDDPPPQEILQKLEKDFIANLESVMEQKKKEFDRRAQETAQKAISSVDAKTSASLSQIGDTVKVANAQLREERESLLSAIHLEKKSILDRMKEEANKLSTLVESKTNGALQLIDLNKVKAVEKIQSVGATMTEKMHKMIHAFSRKKQSMMRSLSVAAEETRKSNDGRLSAADGHDGKKAENSVVSPSAPSGVAEGRANKNENKKRSDPPASSRRPSRRRKKEKDELTPEKTIIIKKANLPIRNIAFAARETDSPLQNAFGNGNFSTQSLIVSPAASEAGLESELMASLPSKPRFTSTPQTKATPKSSQRNSFDGTLKDLDEDQKVAKAVHVTREKASKVPVTSQSTPGKQRVTRSMKHKSAIQGRGAENARDAVKDSSPLAATPKSAVIALSSKRKKLTTVSKTPSTNKISSRDSNTATPKSTSTKTSFDRRRRRKRNSSMEASMQPPLKRTKIAQKEVTLEGKWQNQKDREASIKSSKHVTSRSSIETASKPSTGRKRECGNSSHKISSRYADCTPPNHAIRKKESTYSKRRPPALKLDIFEFDGSVN
jgi:hypothetical protein